jgi:hypothetical protein
MSGESAWVSILFCKAFFCRRSFIKNIHFFARIIAVVNKLVTHLPNILPPQNSKVMVPSNFLRFLAKPQSWGEAPRFAVFPPKFTPGHAGPPSAPPAPESCKAP